MFTNRVWFCVFIFRRQPQSRQLIPKPVHIIDFQENHGVVDPILNVGILQIKPQGSVLKYDIVGFSMLS